jgi:uncharacterized membrane protein
MDAAFRGATQDSPHVSHPRTKNPRRDPPHHLRPVHLVPRRAISRLAIGVAVGSAVGLALSRVFSIAVCLVGAWDAAALTLIILSWITITSCSAAQTSERAAGEDAGRNAVSLFAVLASAVSLFAATVLSRQARAIAPVEARELIALCLGAVVFSWLLTHTLLTLRYAHLYYREDGEGVGGVTFAGGAPPTYFDFAYLAFTIGICFQVSDMSVTTGIMRRTVLAHAVLSFAYNTVVLAFTLNLLFALMA